jgi:hypothetical protein
LDIWDKRYIFAEKSEAMTIITGSQFRSNQGKYIGMAHRGERVIISSKSGYAELTPVSDDDKEIKKHINSKCFLAIAKQAWEEHEQEKPMRFESAADAQKWMDNL